MPFFKGSGSNQPANDILKNLYFILFFDWHVILVHIMRYNVIFWFMYILDSDQLRVISISITLTVLMENLYVAPIVFPNIVSSLLCVS